MTAQPGTPDAYHPIQQSRSIVITPNSGAKVWVSLPSLGVHPRGIVSDTARVTSRTLDCDLQFFDGAGLMVYTKPVTILDTVTGQWVNQEFVVDPRDTDPLIPRIEATGGVGKWQVVARCGDTLIDCGEVRTAGVGGGPNWAVPKPCSGCGS